MKKFLIAVVLMCLVFGFTGTAWADINVQTFSAMPDLYKVNITATNALPRQYIPLNEVVSEVVYLENSYPAFKTNDFNLYVINQTVSNQDNGLTLSKDCAYLFAYLAIWPRIADLNFTPALVAHELGHEVRFTYLTTDELDQYIAQRGITDAERAYFHKYYPNENINEEVFAEDFRQLFGGPYAQVTIYYDNIPAPTEQDRQWILEHLPASK